jgi:hypothetical protein
MPDFPTSRAVPESREQDPLQFLRMTFADDPEMTVTQDPDGTIRMIEKDVPTDLLDVKIAHVSFDSVYDPAVAMGVIAATPEVQSFMKTNQIEWPLLDNSGLGLAILPTPEMPHLSGHLDSVTFAQALDYVLKTFPGFWIYENCQSDRANRMVFLEFFPVPGRFGQRRTEKTGGRTGG